MASHESTRWTSLVLAGTILASLLAAGCGSPAAPTPVLETETFTGTVAVNGADIKTFVVTYSAVATDASMTVTSLVSVTSQTPVVTTIGIGFGSVSGNGTCVLRPEHTTSSAPLNQELVASAVFAAGTYCFRIFDAGTLTEPLSYTVVIKHY